MYVPSNYGNEYVKTACTSSTRSSNNLHDDIVYISMTLIMFIRYLLFKFEMHVFSVKE